MKLSICSTQGWIFLLDHADQGLGHHDHDGPYTVAAQATLRVVLVTATFRPSQSGNTPILPFLCFYSLLPLAHLDLPYSSSYSYSQTQHAGEWSTKYVLFEQWH